MAEPDVPNRRRKLVQRQKLAFRTARLVSGSYCRIGDPKSDPAALGTGDDPPVDASGELPDGRAFSNAKEFQHLLMADLDAFNRTFIEKLAIYGLRRTMTFDDREGLQAIAEVSRTKDYRVRAILEAFVLSDLFRKR